MALIRTIIILPPMLPGFEGIQDAEMDFDDSLSREDVGGALEHHHVSKALELGHLAPTLLGRPSHGEGVQHLTADSPHDVLQVPFYRLVL